LCAQRPSFPELGAVILKKKNCSHRGLRSSSSLKKGEKQADLWRGRGIPKYGTMERGKRDKTYGGGSMGAKATTREALVKPCERRGVNWMKKELSAITLKKSIWG